VTKQEAAERLGARFAECAYCKGQYVWHEEETFAVMSRPPDGGDYDDGSNEIVFCCSHLCASRQHATLRDGSAIIWRGGKCGGTSLPSLEEP
jgi:hypothetical protein